jgi:hypothetical protein
MNSNDQHQSYPVGAQFIGAPPMYRPLVLRCAFQADKSTRSAIHWHLQNDRSWSFMFIIAGNINQPAHSSLREKCHAECNEGSRPGERDPSLRSG